MVRATEEYRWDAVPGVFGRQERLGQVFAREDGAECLVAPSDIMEAPAGDWWTAWVEGEYSSHFVHEDPLHAARVVLDMVYGEEQA